MSHDLGSLPSLPHLTISTAILAGEVPQGGAAGDAPAWIKVTPRGPVEARDGRRYSFTPETLVARFKADGIDVPADLNHALALRGAKGEAADAIGWAKELQARPDGTYARMEWLGGGKAVLAARTHRYVSPTFHHTEDGEATWLHSIALLAAPALSMPALAGAGMSAPGVAPASVREALGLPATADEAACLAAIAELRTAFVPVTLFSDTVAALNAANATLGLERGVARTAQVDRLLDGALREGKMFPAERRHYEALCSTETGLTGVGMLLASRVPHGLFGPSGLDGRQPDDGASETPETLAARATRYRHQQEKAGVPMTQAAAVAFAHANPTAGR